MSHISNDLFYEARGEWLEEMGRKEGDVIFDKKGEYILVGADEEGQFEKIYLPEAIQQKY